jgi:hypothetical protein
MKFRLIFFGTLIISSLLAIYIKNKQQTPKNMYIAPQPVASVAITTRLQPLAPGEFNLSIKAQIPKGYHIYSINQDAVEGLEPTTINFTPNLGVTPETDWSENPLPVIRRYDFLPGVKVQILMDTVEWTVKLRAFDIKTIPRISGIVSLQLCSDTKCLGLQQIKF